MSCVVASIYAIVTKDMVLVRAKNRLSIIRPDEVSKGLAMEVNVPALDPPSLLLTVYQPPLYTFISINPWRHNLYNQQLLPSEGLNGTRRRRIASGSGRLGVRL